MYQLIKPTEHRYILCVSTTSRLNSLCDRLFYDTLSAKIDRSSDEQWKESSLVPRYRLISTSCVMKTVILMAVAPISDSFPAFHREVVSIPWLIIKYWRCNLALAEWHPSQMRRISASNQSWLKTYPINYCCRYWNVVFPIFWTIEHSSYEILKDVSKMCIVSVKKWLEIDFLYK